MKHSTFVTFSAVGSLALILTSSSCSQADAAASTTQPHAPENGAQFAKGQGLTLTEEMKKALSLKTADVGEDKIASAVTMHLSVLKAGEASGWLAPKQAALVTPGSAVDIQLEDGGHSMKGTVQRVEKVSFGTLSDSEVIITPAQPVTVGTRLKATFHTPAGDSVPVVPRSALLTTAEGTFVYAVNDAFFVRTPVKIGAANENLVEITDGLYSGDQVVTTPVMSLWMAELQVLRGGKACTCGH